MERDRSTFVACLLDDMLGDLVAESIQHEGQDLRAGSKASARFWFDGAWYVASVEQVEAP